MKGDFSRWTHDPSKHYTRVLSQQGRVSLDADWNEQQAIVEYLRDAEARDAIGPCGAPRDHAGFAITVASGGTSVAIGRGRYYVDGILCENETEGLAFENQPDLPMRKLSDGTSPPWPQNFTDPLGKACLGLVYLDVHARHITSLEDPSILEPALQNVDTATRSKTVWQVRVLPWTGVFEDPAARDALQSLLEKRAELEAPPSAPARVPSPVAMRALVPASAQAQAVLLGPRMALESELADVQRQLAELLVGVDCRAGMTVLGSLRAGRTGMMSAQLGPSEESPDPCKPVAGAAYRGLENQLYRVEIHSPGPLGKATFKWSRWNGSIVTPWLKPENESSDQVRVQSLGRDQVLRIAAGDWVELTDDAHELWGLPGTLVQVTVAEDDVLTLDTKDGTISIDWNRFPVNPKVRLWDQDSAAIPTGKDWVDLEDGIQVRFEGEAFQTGDYWLIPARAATQSIEWPTLDGPPPVSKAMPPLGIHHHICPLAIVARFVKDGKESLFVVDDCRHVFPPITEFTSLFYVSGDGQEARLGERLPGPLQVGVAEGDGAVEGALVQFRVIAGKGTLQSESKGGQASVVVPTDARGLAQVAWTLDAETAVQGVEASLLGAAHEATHIPIRFASSVLAARSVAYDPGQCETLRRQNVADVQAAIDLLCAEKRTEGCEVIVDVKDDLQAIIQDLIKAGRKDLRLCLRPGIHEPRAGVRVESKEPRPDIHLRIGGGLGTQLRLGSGSMILTQFGSVSLRNLAVQGGGDEGLLVLGSCDDVRIEGCNLSYSAPSASSTLLMIRGARRLLLRDSVLDSHVPAEVVSPGEVTLPPLHLVAETTMDAGAAVAAGGSKTIAEVASLPRKAGIVSGEAVSSVTEKAQMEPTAAIAEVIPGSMPAPQPAGSTTGEVGGKVEVTRKPRLVPLPALALVIRDSTPDAVLENNDIQGVISLYGPPGPSFTTSGWSSRTPEWDAKFVTALRTRLSFTDAGNRLVFSRNRLDRVDVSAEFVKRIEEGMSKPADPTKIRLSASISLPTAYQVLLVTENVFRLVDRVNVFLAQHLAFTTNDFQGKPPGAQTQVRLIAGLALSASSSYVGNHATVAETPFYDLKQGVAGESEAVANQSLHLGLPP